MSKTSISYYEKIAQHFLRKGKKKHLGKLFSQLLFNRAKKKVFSVELMSTYLKTCYHRGMPYMRLKTKILRRGKRVIYKRRPISKINSERFTLSLLKKQVFAQSNESFRIRLEKQVELFGTNKNYPARVLRDKIHRICLRYAKKKNIKHLHRSCLR